ncbi:MAG: efflux RND transporter periplasmic adaptor subunit [Syntrophobacterales bacterium]|jgi:HlyD family secretion protein
MLKNLWHNLLTFVKESSWKRLSLLGLLVVLLFTGAIWFWQGDNGGSDGFRTAPVTKGDLQAVISATGTVEPEEVVDVGAQVAGKIVAFGKDKNGKTVDYGSVVEAGTVLAQIDDALYAADLANTKAQVEQSKANVQRAESDLGQLKAKLYQAERDWMRAQKLGPSDALSQADYDAALSAYEIAKANVKVGQAAVAQAKNAVAQAEAARRKAQQNLDYCTIVSPVKGVIIDRRVNIGQTVVSSLNAPSLFLIAKDLKRLQVWASVNEADIGNIRPGQPVTFTVDAYPGETFEGKVGKIRLNATMTQNVVTYTVEVNTDNKDGKLIPYLTANLKFMVAERNNVLMVPNAALRWIPQPDQIAPQVRQVLGERKRNNPGGQEASAGKEDTGRPRQGVLWIPQGKYVKPMKVSLGLSDGSLTEVQNPKLKEGMQVVLGEQIEGKSAPSTASPFTPKIFQRRGSKKKQ